MAVKELAIACCSFFVGSAVGVAVIVSTVCVENYYIILSAQTLVLTLCSCCAFSLLCFIGGQECQKDNVVYLM